MGAYTCILGETRWPGGVRIKKLTLNPPLLLMPKPSSRAQRPSLDSREKAGKAVPPGRGCVATILGSVKG